MSSRIRKRAYHTLLQAFRLKKRKRMGRPRLAERPRYVSGKVADRPRAAERDDVLSVATEARQRLFGLTAEESIQPEWGSALGRLLKWGEITREQFEAGARYRQLRFDVDREAGIKPLPSGSDVQRQSGHDSRDGTDQNYVDWSRGVRTRYQRCLEALRGCGDPYAFWALEWAVVGDKDVGVFKGALRVGLNVVGKVLGT
jgi:hypothetical protein